MNKKLLIFGGLGFLLLSILGIFKRKEIGAAVQRGYEEISLALKRVYTAAGQLVFRAVVSKQAAPYVDQILKVSEEEDVDPFVIEALGYRETLWGTAKALDKPGPAGRGDFGHGHGLMQIDDGTNGTWLQQNDWTDPYTNIKKGVKILKGKFRVLGTKVAIKYLTDGVKVSVNAKEAARRGVQPGNFPDPRPLAGPELIRAGIAAYNTGEGNVLISLATGKDPDHTTAKGDYSAAVFGRAGATATAFRGKIA